MDFASSPPAPRSLHPGAVTAARPGEDEDAPGGGLGTRCPPPPLGPVHGGFLPRACDPLPLFYFGVKTWTKWPRLLSWISSFSYPAVQGTSPRHQRAAKRSLLETSDWISFPLLDNLLRKEAD